MRYQISGRQIDVGEALSTHVENELDATFEKYAQRPTESTVIFSRDAYNLTCDAVVHLPTGLRVQAKGQDVERRVLAQAVRWHTEHRVLLNGHRTVVFA